MNILLYDYHELEDRASKKLSVWKAWHTTIFVFAAVFGILNYVFLQSTMQLVDNNCVLYPRFLDFHWTELPRITIDGQKLNESSEIDVSDEANSKEDVTYVTDDDEDELENEKGPVKRETSERNGTDFEYITKRNESDYKNISFITANTTHRLMLFTGGSIYGKESTCQFAEFMPLLSFIFAVIWITFFVMCPGTGRTRTGLPKPYRILPPALVFALVMVVLTGYSFTSTNGGIHAFCAAFSNYTNNATTCSPVNDYLERGWNATWGFGSRAAATRAAAAGVWVSWACAASLMLARCLAAPDFVMRHSSVNLVKDPEQKIAPQLRKSPRNSQRSRRSLRKLDNMSTSSEPTMTTDDVVTASVDHGPDSDPTSLATTPVKHRDPH